MTITTLRSRMDINTRDNLDAYRAEFGNRLHAAACLGAIDGAAASLAASAGPRATAMALYRAADAMAVREPPEPIVLRSESHGYCSIFAMVWGALTCPHRPKGR